LLIVCVDVRCVYVRVFVSMSLF